MIPDPWLDKYEFGFKWIYEHTNIPAYPVGHSRQTTVSSLTWRQGPLLGHGHGWQSSGVPAVALP